ncbi:hypothetical protein [Longimicrobium sp.]|uniref:hypothetical protein n=1 Tax=Longimicrobium sp. TaxID=2029185 RepID=UPI002B891139|nr:hypothetical protein [Longimicrobium sp.]HSU17138.1 hypothetical protein [Longimicrobium sp.]
MTHEEPTAVQDSLRGPVRSVRLTFTGAVGGSDVVIVTTYDRGGRRAELLTYRADDLRSRLVYTYDERGRNTGWEFYEVPRGGGPHTAYHESPPGTPLPTVPQRRVYVLDEAGRRMEEREILPNGTLLSHMEFAYDSAGRTRLMTQFDSRGEQSSRTAQEYDAAGRVRAQRFFYGGRESRTVYDYDERGNLVLLEATISTGGWRRARSSATTPPGTGWRKRSTTTPSRAGASSTATTTRGGCARRRRTTPIPAFSRCRPDPYRERWCTRTSPTAATRRR